jgi:predicted ATP-grasp superfamily ATP-dependent carboligase
MMSVGALVLGGDYRGLGIIRSLGRRGIDVWNVHAADTLATHSRYCRRAFRSAAGNDDAYVQELLELARRHRLDGWVLFPTSDETAWVVSRFREALSRRYRVTTPCWSVYSAAADKASVHRIAESIGIDTPQSWFPTGMADVEALDADYPLVLKPARRLAVNPFTFAKAWRVADRAELLRRYRQAAGIVPPGEIMIQEWVPGNGDRQYAFAAVCTRGAPKLSVAACRARQYPRDFGRASTYVETIDHPGVAKQASRLLQELEIDGLVEVEFKEDAELGTLKLLDVNLRVWGWHSLGAPAGVDFSYWAYRLALGDDVPVQSGAAGVRWVRFAVDAPCALADVVAGRMRLADYARTLRPPLEGPIWARDDPRPAVWELPLLLRTLRRQRVELATAER